VNRNLIDEIVRDMWAENEQIPIDIQNRVR